MLTWKDMHSFGRHFSTLSSPQKVQHMKFVYDLHSTGDRKQKLSQTGPASAVSTCPCCLKSQETPFHLLHCQSNSARNTAIKDLSVSLRKLRDNPYGRIFAELASQWMCNPDVTPSLTACRDTQVSPSLFHPEYLQLIQTSINDQTEIGWHNLIKGFLAKSWHVLASTYPPNRRTAPIIQDDGHRRIQRTIKALRTMALAIWEARNHTLHHAAQSTATSIRTATDAVIARLHEQRSSLLVADKHYCNISLSKLLSSRPSYKRRWLRRVRKAQENYQLENHHQPKLTVFFPHAKIRDHIKQKSKITDPTLAPSTTAAESYKKRTQHNSSTQQLLTAFLKERASNLTSHLPTSSPPPEI